MSKLAVQIHKTVVELPMNINELAMILSADLEVVRAEVASMRKQGLVKANSEGRYIPERELTDDSAKIMGMISRLSA